MTTDTTTTTTTVPPPSCVGICGPATVTGNQLPFDGACYDIGIGNGVGQMSHSFFPCDLATGEYLIEPGTTYTVDPIDAPATALSNENGSIVSVPPYSTPTELPATGIEGGTALIAMAFLVAGIVATTTARRAARCQGNTSTESGDS